MKLQEKEYKLYELYTILKDEVKDDLFVEEFFKQNIDFSRIAFKEFRDKLVKNHQGYAVEEETDGGKGFCRQMYNIDRLEASGEVDFGLGRVVDFNVPMKRCEESKCSDFEISNINLITEVVDKVYLIEAREKGSNETLLSTVFEIVTKMDMLSRRKIISDFSEAQRNAFKYRHKKDDVTPAVILYEGSKAHQDLLKTDPNSLIGGLVYKYHIHFFILKNDTESNVYKLV